MFVPRLEALEARAIPAAFDPTPGIFVTLNAAIRPGYWSNPVVGSQLLKTWDLVPELGLWSIPQGTTVDDAIAKISLNQSVVRVEADRLLDSKLLFNDPLFPQQWGLANSGANGANGADGAIAGADIHAEPALARFQGTGGTLVAIIDTGVDYTHPELASRMWVNPSEISGNGIDDDKNGFVDDVFGANFVNGTGNPMDDNGHGTHIAGIIAATANNEIGVTGVNPNARIMALKFLDSQGFGDLTGAISALDYAVSKGARISNNSWGGAGFSSTLSDAMDRARSKGHLVVAAAGNDSLNIDSNPSYPASFIHDNIVVVASTSAQDQISWFSNFGKAGVDIGAPGEAIISTLPGGKYGFLSGTSMATPFVTGALSLLWDRRPDLSYQEIIKAVLGQSDISASLFGKTTTGGRLNLDRALAAVEAKAVDAVLPFVLSGDFAGNRSDQISQIRLEFSEPMEAATLAPNISLTSPAGKLIPLTWAPVTGQSTKAFIGTMATQTALGTYALLVKAGVKDLNGNALDQNHNGKAGETTDSYRLATTLAASASWSNATKVAIRDLRTGTSVISVPTGVTVERIQVGINITHSDLSDLYITLKSPTGKIFVLVNRDATGRNIRDLIFEDSATTAFSDGVAPYSGTYRPAKAMGNLGKASATGNWTLSVTDRVMVDQGTLNSWTLRFVPEKSVGQSIRVRGASHIGKVGVSASMMGGGGGGLLQSLLQPTKPTNAETLADLVFHEGQLDIVKPDLATQKVPDFGGRTDGSIHDFAFAQDFAFGPWNGELRVPTSIATHCWTDPKTQAGESAGRWVHSGPLNRDAAVAKRGESVVLTQNKVRFVGTNHIECEITEGRIGLNRDCPE